MEPGALSRLDRQFLLSSTGYRKVILLFLQFHPKKARFTFNIPCNFEIIRVNLTSILTAFPLESTFSKESGLGFSQNTIYPATDRPDPLHVHRASGEMTDRALIWDHLENI